MAFYGRLLKETDRDVFRSGEWHLCERSGWPDNAGFQNLVAWCWRKDDDRYLIVVNLSGASAQALVRIPWDDVKGKFWQLADVFSGDVYKLNGDEMQEQGLYVDLPGWGYHFVQFKRG